MNAIRKVGDLDVYRRLVELHLHVHHVSLGFPKFELYELGSQMRRSSNSAPANLAEGFNNPHRRIYLESISRALGEMRETQHHLMVAHRKGYVDSTTYEQFIDEYNQCSRILRTIHKKITASLKT